MRTLIYTFGVLMISAPLRAQTNFSGAGTTTSPVTGAPSLNLSNTSPVPPTLDRTSPVNNTGFETSGANSGFSTTGTATGTGTGTSFGTGASSNTSPVPQTLDRNIETGRPGANIMNPANSGAPIGTGWEGI